MLVYFFPLNHKSAVIGIWRQDDNSSCEVIEFRKDGTFLRHDGFGTFPFAYSWLPDGRIGLRQLGVNDSGISHFTNKVQVSLNRLTLTEMTWSGTNFVSKYHRLGRSELRRLNIDFFKDAQLVRLPPTAAPDQVVAALFSNSIAGQKMTLQKTGEFFVTMTSHGSPYCVSVETDRGKRLVQFEYDRPEIGIEDLRGWFCKIDAPPTNLLWTLPQ